MRPLLSASRLDQHERPGDWITGGGRVSESDPPSLSCARLEHSSALRVFLAGLMVLTAACDSARRACLDIAADYAAALPEALQCDAAVPETCAVNRPVVVYLEDANGIRTLEGLCLPPCTHSVNPARVARLDTLLAEFASSGCEFRPCWCPPPSPASCGPEGNCIWGGG